MKRKTQLFLGCLILLLITVVHGNALAGMVVEQVMKDKDGIPSRVVLYFSDYQFRTDHPEGGLSMIMDFKGDRLVMIDHGSKNYVEVKLSQWEKEVAKQLKKEFARMKKPKERQISVKRTGRTAMINGFSTEQVEIFADNERIEEDWMTRDVEMKEIEKVMDRVARGFSKDFRSEMKEGREIYEKLKPYGYPILVKDYATSYGLGAIDRVEVKQLEKRDLKDAFFLPPLGYQKVIPESGKKK
ncbi:MAG: DUF4412 domain-containing protein [Thermodesulfobacteriota bacterium]